MNKKVLFIISVLVFLLTFVNTSLATGTTNAEIKLEVENNLSDDKTITVSIYGKDIKDLYAMSIDLKYDKSLLEVVEYQASKPVNDANNPFYNEANALNLINRYNATDSSIIEYVTLLLGNVPGFDIGSDYEELAIVKFKLKNGVTAPDEIPFNITDDIVNNGDINIKLVNSVDDTKAMDVTINQTTNEYKSDGTLDHKLEYKDGVKTAKFTYEKDDQGNNKLKFKFAYKPDGTLNFRYWYDEKGKIIANHIYTKNANGDYIFKYKYAYKPDGTLNNKYWYDENGKVKSNYIYTKDANGKYIYKYKYQYKADGTLFYKYWYDENGKVVSNFIYTKDANGKYIYKYKYQYKADGTLFYKYWYDANGKVISNYIYTKDANGKDIYKYKYQYKPDGTLFYKYWYDENGKVVANYIYTKDANGKNIYKYKYGYNADGSLNHKNIYNEKGQIISKYTYVKVNGKDVYKYKFEYDENGKVINKHTY